MTVAELAEAMNLVILTGSEEGGLQREVAGCYCCDLLSMTMGRAKKDDAYITVMANVNTVAVSLLTDISCIIFSEGITPGDDVVGRASIEDIPILLSGEPTFETAVALSHFI